MTIRQHAARVQKLGTFLIGSEGGFFHRVLRSGFWVALNNGLYNLLTFARQVVMARLLAPEAFGLMGLCLVVTRALDLVTVTGSGPALIHRQERVEEAKNTAFFLQIVRGFVIAVMTLPLAAFAASYYGEPLLQPLVFVLSLSFVLNGFSNINTVLQSKKLDFRRLTMMDSLTTVGGTVVLISLAFWLRSVWALVIGNVAQALIRVALSYIIIPGRATPRFDRTMARELFGYGRFVTGFTIIQFLTTEVDNMVVGKLLGFEPLGVYTMAYMLANLPATHIARTAAVVLFPAYSAIQKDVVKLRAAYTTALRVIGGLAIPAAAGMIALAPDLVRIMYGERWLPGVTPLRILSLMGAARAVAMLSGYLYNAIGKPHVSFYVIMGRLILVLGSIYYLTSRFGLAGAAMSVALPQVAEQAIGVFLVRKYIGVPVAESLKILGRIIFCSVAMAGVCLLLRAWLAPIDFFDLAAIVILGIGTYLLLSYNELRSLWREVSGKASKADRESPAIP